MKRELHDQILAGLRGLPQRVAQHNGRTIASEADLEFIVGIEGIEEPEAAEPVEIPDNLEELTTEGLYDLCRQLGISPVPKLKAERIAALEAKRAELAAEE